MAESVRVRFAPSPTGHLHVGGARTALFNWLFARHHGGAFLLRIEDTDRDRSTDEAIQQILGALTWLGLDWDQEGPEDDGAYRGYFRQTSRFEIYRAHAERLLAEGRAYRCYCTPEELDARREAAQARGETFRYDGRCRDLPLRPGVPAALRLRIPDAGTTVVPDLIHGDVTFDRATLDDWILVRSDGTPTYNFCVVVDDVTTKITHVIRGNDHLSNTPKQILCYEALGYAQPVFAHIPMILGPDRKRLSKRHGATSVLAFRDEGFLPEAMVNYFARLGWAHGDQEVLHAGRADPPLRPPARRRARRDLRPDEARVAEPGVDEATAGRSGRPQAASSQVDPSPGAGWDRQPAAAAGRECRGQSDDPSSHAFGHGGEGAVLLRGPEGLRSDGVRQAGDAGTRATSGPAAGTPVEARSRAWNEIRSRARSGS